MEKMLKKEQSVKEEREDNYNKPVNKWLREYLEQISPGYGHKVDSDKEFANKCKIKYSRIRNITNGNAQVNIEDLMKISKATGISCDEIILKKEVPKNLNLNAIDVVSKEAYNVMSKHTIQKNVLFQVPYRDNFLNFLSYLICEENFINTLSEKSYKILEDIKSSNIEIDMTKCKDEKDFLSKPNNKLIKKEINELITDKKIRQDVRKIICKYIYQELLKSYRI